MAWKQNGNKPKIKHGVYKMAFNKKKSNYNCYETHSAELQVYLPQLDYE